MTGKEIKIILRVFLARTGMRKGKSAFVEKACRLKVLVARLLRSRDRTRTSMRRKLSLQSLTAREAGWMARRGTPPRRVSLSAMRNV